MTVKELRNQLIDFRDDMKVYMGIKGQVEPVTNLCLVNIEDNWVGASPGDEDFNEDDAICMIE